ncbi:MAG: hypothetical protein R3F11_10210 [Verrucomicrobiales bacterium]
MVKALASRLDGMRRQIDAFENQIEALYASHPEHELFARLPGRRNRVGVQAAGASGTDRDRFADARG